MKDIFLSQILPITNLKEFKLHRAIWNGVKEPLDVFVRDRNEWNNWNRWKGGKIEFNRKYIFSLMRFYPEKNDPIWLFGGIYEVLDRTGAEYKIKTSGIGEEFVGRLKIRSAPSGRNARVKLEGQYESMVVTEILKEPYAGEIFQSYEDIHLSFESLNSIVKNGRIDWRVALEKIKGVYLITDAYNGKCYIGSAYSDGGVWSRWQEYLENGHGGNVELKALIKKEGLEYARKNFLFTLLEYRSARTDNTVITNREVFWKKALLSRGPEGYNRN